MPSVTNPLNGFASVKLDGSGNGIASIGPQRVREHWQPSSASVSVSSNTLEAQCSVYLGSTLGSATFLGQTATGSTGDTCGIGVDMQTGMLIWAKWSGGDPGAIATLVPNGEYTIGAP